MNRSEELPAKLLEIYKDIRKAISSVSKVSTSYQNESPHSVSNRLDEIYTLLQLSSRLTTSAILAVATPDFIATVAPGNIANAKTVEPNFEVYDLFDNGDRPVGEVKE